MSKQLTTVEQFNKKLVSFAKAVKTTQNAARMCSNFAILHFEKCGDIGPAQRFYDVLRKEGNRKFLKRDGYLVWLFTHAPITFEEKDGKRVTSTLVKDKSAEAVKFDTKTATATPYWMFSQDQDEEIPFSGEDVWKEVNRIVNKYSGDKYSDNDNTGDTAVRQVKDLVKKHAPELVAA
jgi:hypothetical protein|tara:strand:- start:1319 stop:1852 length:534 start_codon:yes stop_codon:yes gene_type:complete